MDWWASVDAYCERLDPGFWAEPVNALTNAAFLVAALAAWGLARARGRIDPAVGLLIAILAVIGLGSFLFHTFANRWSGVADVLPIAVFIHVYFYLALTRLHGLSRRVSAFATVLFLLGGFAVARLASGLGSGAGYLPAALAMPGVAVALRLRGLAGAGPLLAAAGVFIVSLAFRTADAAVCPAFPLGTHFVWHCLNAVVLFLLIRLLIRAKGEEATVAAPTVSTAEPWPGAAPAADRKPE
jgi:hypothetical protein